MNLAVQKAPLFQGDVTNQFAWYFDQAGEEIAWRFFATVDLTLLKLSRQPDLGRLRHFRHPSLQGLRSLQVDPLFNRLPVFYRHTQTEVVAERLMHGARDLPRRLAESLP
jgi:plasmid stabilization system protein ParE